MIDETQNDDSTRVDNLAHNKSVRSKAKSWRISDDEDRIKTKKKARVRTSLSRRHIRLGFKLWASAAPEFHLSAPQH